MAENQQGAGARSGNERKEVVRDEEARRFMADQGTSKTSHGDGTPTIDRTLLEARERELKAREDAEKAEEREVEALKKAAKK